MDVEDVARHDDGVRVERVEMAGEAVDEAIVRRDRRLDVRGGQSPDVEVGEDQGVGGFEVRGATPVLDVHHVNRRTARGKPVRLAGPSWLAPNTAASFIGIYEPARRYAGMVDVLADKRTATRFRILVEIADRQPAVSQGEIADAVGVTSQAVSEYIRDLVADGLVDKQGRSRYRVTTEGVDWLLRNAADVRRYADRVTDDVLGSVHEDAAIALGDISQGETVSLEMQDGYMHARPDASGPATGVATTDAAAGDDVGVTGFEGIIDLEPGRVTVYQVPPVRAGGSDAADLEALESAGDAADIVLATGVEAIVSLQKAGLEPDVTFAVGEVAADAADRGLDIVVVATADAVGRVTDPLRDAGASYEVTDLD